MAKPSLMLSKGEDFRTTVNNSITSKSEIDPPAGGRNPKFLKDSSATIDGAFACICCTTGTESTARRSRITITNKQYPG